MRPTEREPASMTPLRDPEVADWIESLGHAALLFWDPEDAACQRLRARLELVAAAANVPVATVDIRSDALVARAMGVTSVPTLVVFRQAELVERVIGSAPENVLSDALAARR